MGFLLGWREGREAQNNRDVISFPLRCLLGRDVPGLGKMYPYEKSNQIIFFLFSFTFLKIDGIWFDFCFVLNNRRND